MPHYSQIRTTCLLLSVLVLSACGDDGGDEGGGDVQSQSGYTVGGTVSGLQGSGLVLQNDGGGDLAINGDGAFTFSATQASGERYNVTVATQPSGPSQTCTVGNSSGTVADSDVTDITVSCANVNVPDTAAGEPTLAFSDLVSGPNTGLGDGYGDGAIVTVWGNNLDGASQRMLFRDSNGTVHEPYVYYWKNADSTLPSGPANLYASHRMQEIAFSIPEAASAGVGEIYVEVNGETSGHLPFTVRAGSIYHVTDSGSDAGDGSWAAPWRTMDHADATAPAGSTIYVHDVTTGDADTARGIYWNNLDASSTLDAQFAILAYPGTRPTVIAQRGVEAYRTQGMVVSKLDVYASNHTAVDANDQPSGDTITFGGTFGIHSSRNGRAVANRIGDIPGGCASKTQGAIVGTARFDDYVSNFKILGNEIHDYGCHGSSKLHHTTYMTIRSEGLDRQVEPWEFGYNYLHGNRAKGGIHQFDQNEGCGDTTGPIRIHDNVVVDQAGPGISVGSQCDWSMDVIIENNVLINVGLAADWDGVDPDSGENGENGGIVIRDSGLLGTMHVRNNLVYGYATDGQSEGAHACLLFTGSSDNVTVLWNDNICVTSEDLDFVGAGYQAEPKLDNVSGGHNVWYYLSLRGIQLSYLQAIFGLWQ